LHPPCQLLLAFFARSIGCFILYLLLLVVNKAVGGMGTKYKSYAGGLQNVWESEEEKGLALFVGAMGI
jgi:hypothetical protein